MKKALFSPIVVGAKEIKNRIELAPVFHGLASFDGFVTKELILYYEALAKGGAGIITIGVSTVDYEYGKAHEKELNLGDDRVIGGLHELVEHIQLFGALASIEISHGGKVTPYNLIGKPPLAPSAIPTELQLLEAKKTKDHRSLYIEEMSIDQIEKVKKEFADAALRCKKAGFEMIMIHGAHGQLLAQFVSKASNKRIDHYGGSLENRARFVVETLEAIREKVGKEMVIEYRISAEELIKEGMTLEETIEFLKMIEDMIDLIHVSSGVITSPHLALQIIPPIYLPRGSNIKYACEIKKHIKKPVAVVGGLDMKLAEEIISEGKADIVAMARTILADPESVKKYRRGQNKDIRPCIRCNECTRRTAPPRFWSIRCTVNPELGREWEPVFIGKKRKKIAVFGGGPAGMQAAITLASRGHRVILYEKESFLGGMLRYAVIPPFKKELKDFLDWLIYKVEGSKDIELRLGQEADIGQIKEEGFDVVIVATGGRPVGLEVKGEMKPLWVGEALLYPERVSKEVLIIGAGLAGCEAALYLSQKGKNVNILDQLTLEELMEESPSLFRAILLKLSDTNVKLYTGFKVIGFDKGSVKAVDKEKKEITFTVDNLVYSLGIAPETRLFRRIEREFEGEVYAIGDCVKPGRLMDAIHSAFNIARRI